MTLARLPWWGSLNTSTLSGGTLLSGAVRGSRARCHANDRRAGSLTFRHGEVRVDLQGRVAYTNGQLAKLGSRAFDLLEALIERRDRLVPKQELKATSIAFDPATLDADQYVTVRGVELAQRSGVARKQ